MLAHQKLNKVSSFTIEPVTRRLDLGNQFNNNYLTKREIQIVEYVVMGYTAKQIGQLLQISFRTVETYIDKLKMKLNCNSKRDIAKAVIKSNIIYQLNILEKTL